MSIFAGIASISGDAIPAQFHEGLLQVFPRGSWQRNEYRSSTAVILHATQSIFGQCDWKEDQRAVMAIAGLPVHKDALDNPADLFFRAFIEEKLTTVLPSANGTFTSIWHNKYRNTLVIASDSLGGRPMYYAKLDTYLFFSTSLSLLRSLPWLKLTPDLSAFAEQEALGYPLGHRTCFQEVHVMRDNELLVVSEKKLQTSRYYDWTTVANDTWDDVDAVAREAANAVKIAISERASKVNKEEAALLSGGLDSRVIVSLLDKLGKPIQAINLSRHGCQDDVFARRFAQHLGISLEKAPWSPLLPGITTGDTTARMLAAATKSLRGRAVFSGDGGGETLGLLLLEPTTHDLLVAGDLDAAVIEHIHSYAPPKRLLDNDTIACMTNSANRALLTDLSSIKSIPVSKSMQLSLICNDLRCHLHDYFDRIAETEVELLLPFYDRRVIAAVLRLPIPLDKHLYHHFYMRVLNFLPEDIKSVAWQSYPRRAPSPIPPDVGLPNQWSTRNRYFGDEQCRKVTTRMLKGMVAPPIRKSVLTVAIILHRLRVKNFTSSFKFVNAMSELYEHPKLRAKQI